jgi:hypothetical protein
MAAGSRTLKKTHEWWAELRALPPLTTATATIYGCGAVLLIAGTIVWQPGKNPRWVIGGLAVLATLFFFWILARGPRFSQAEALVLTAMQMMIVGMLTWTTHLTLGAFANGTVLPIMGAYVIWFLRPASGRVVLYLGCLWWFSAIVHQADASLVPSSRRRSWLG